MTALPRPIELGVRRPGGSWERFAPGSPPPGLAVALRPLADDRLAVALDHPEADGLEVAFDAVPGCQYLGGGEQFERLDLAGLSVRYYLENAGLGSGTYLPLPWIATTAGHGFLLDGEAPAVFHLAPPWDPHRVRIQVEGPALRLEVQGGGLDRLYQQLVARIGPPLLPPDAFFGLWKAGDWRTEHSGTVAADVAGFARLGLPLDVKLIDAYWEDEVHSFAFDPAKYPDAWGMVERLAAQGTQLWLWLCPWLVVGSRAFEAAAPKGFLIADGQGRPITRRPGANPNVVAALIDYSNPAARAWWAESLRGLLDRGIAGFKADFGEQLPEHAVLHSGETGGRAHNAYVRHYLQATADAFGDGPPAIVSRSGSAALRTPIWAGDQTSDFCPKAGLPAAIRAAQSASLSGWSFNGSDIGGYFGTPTLQVWARWAEFACFTPLMMIHGLGCREPWDLGPEAARIYAHYARLHRSLRPYFRHHGQIAAAGGQPLIRMMPLAFPEVDWRGVNDWDQQFLLGDALLVAPCAFYADLRAVRLPPGRWFDVMAGAWTEGGQVVSRPVPLDRIPLFVADGAAILVEDDRGGVRPLDIGGIEPWYP